MPVAIPTPSGCRTGRSLRSWPKTRRMELQFYQPTGRWYASCRFQMLRRWRSIQARTAAIFIGKAAPAARRSLPEKRGVGHQPGRKDKPGVEGSHWATYFTCEISWPREIYLKAQNNLVFSSPDGRAPRRTPFPVIGWLIMPGLRRGMNWRQSWRCAAIIPGRFWVTGTS